MTDSLCDICYVHVSQLNPKLVVFIQQHFPLFGIANASGLIPSKETNEEGVAGRESCGG